jgi:DNA-3-methyladenine glycosylase I
MSADDRVRCGWATSAPEYLAYHDDEWGRPLHGDRPLFERLSLEAFQSGLSWLTILRKRAAFRAAFADFDIAAVVPEGLDSLLWSFAPSDHPQPATLADVPSTSPASTAMARELRRRGFRFVGPTTAYALMQATGIVNDHVVSCWLANQVAGR